MEIVAEALVEREAITVILSQKGWIRAQKGHLADDAELKFKEGDHLAFLLRCELTDRIALLGTNGRVYTIKASDIPRGRGDGQAIRLMIELPNEDGILRLFLPDMLGKYLVASTSGRGFIVPGAELVSERRAGRQILNLKPGEEWHACVPVKGDHVAVIGQNRKLLVFPLVEVPEMPKGAGVQLQKYKDGGHRRCEGVSPRPGPDLAPRREHPHGNQARPNGSAAVPRPAACRPTVFRNPVSSAMRASDAIIR